MPPPPKHKSLHSTHTPAAYSKWKLLKDSGHSRTRLSPYPTEHAFLHSYKPARTWGILLMMPSPQQALAPHISPHNPLPPLDKTPPNTSPSLPWGGYPHLSAPFHWTTSLLKQSVPVYEHCCHHTTATASGSCALAFTLGQGSPPMVFFSKTLKHNWT